MFSQAMRARTSAIRSFGIVAAALIGLAGPAVAAGPQTVKENTLSVGSDLTYPPFAYMNEGKPAGFDVEFMQDIAKRLNLTPEFVDTRFASLITGARASHFDVIASALYVTPERQKVLNFIPYIKAGTSILVLKGAEFRPANETELCGKVVASIQGASWLPKLKTVSEGYCAENGLPPIDTREFDTDAQATQAMRAGAVDVEFMDSVVAAELLEKFPDDYEVTSTALIYPILVGIASTPENTELFKVMADAFAEMRKDGAYEALVKSYDMVGLSDDEINAVVDAAR